MPLNPQAQAFLEQAAASGQPPIHELGAQEARAQAGGIAELIGAGPDVEAVEDFAIPVGGGEEIAARRYIPADAHGTVLWLHGGGWVFDGLASADAMCRILANAAAARVVAVDYRVAPEHPFPVPLEDSDAALRWVAEHEPGPLALGGDSAGGNMAAVCALRSRDRGGPPLAAQALVYPVVDTDMTTPSYREHGDNELLILDARGMAWFFEQYLPDPAERSNPEVAPLRAEDLSRLPPAIVLVAEYDPLRDDGLRYADRLERAGVEVTLLRYEDMPHVFFSWVNLFERGNEAVAEVGSLLRARLRGG